MSDFYLNPEVDIEAIAAPDGMAVINREYKIIAFNEAAQRITGFSEDEIISKDVNILFSGCDENAKYIINALTRNQSYSNLSINITTVDGELLNILASITPFETLAQGKIGVIFVFRNTQEMVSLYKKLRETNRELLNEKKILDAIYRSRLEGTFTINNDWIVTSFNRSAERITGYTAREAIGRNCWEIFRSNRCRNGCHMETTMKKKSPRRGSELIITHKNSQKVPIRVNSAPLFDAEENPIGGVETFQDISELKNLSKHLEERFHFENIIGRSKAMQRIYHLLDNVVQSDSNVLITGESGTGKELVARAIHLNSERKSAPFIAVNCSAFAETLLESELFGHEKGAFTGAIRSKPGRFEMSNNGTLFLDEIADLSPAVQVKLLRVVETRQFERVGGTKSLRLNARLITATNKDLSSEVEKGHFRDDLYYRINVINIHLPPLRDRMEDLSYLIQHFLEKFMKRFNKNIGNISPSVSRLFEQYSWPGNIRELENVLEHAFVLCQNKIIQTEHLPERLWSSLEAKGHVQRFEEITDPLKDAELLAIQTTLQKFGGHRGKTAEALGIDKTTLWRKMKKYGLL